MYIVISLCFSDSMHPLICISDMGFLLYIFQIIKARVKEMMIPRFKIICTVHIGESKNSGLWVGSRCLWDASCDTYSTFEYRNKTLFAIGTVFGIYYE